MGFQLSPGVEVNEISLSNVIPSVSTSGGAFVGQFQWGPVEDYTIVSDKLRLESLFGKPSDVNYVDWYSAHNFLAYSNNLNMVRVVEATALNADAETSGVLVKNTEHYDLVIDTAAASIFAAKFPGVMGNSIEVHTADSNTFTDWEFEREFDGAPGTSEYAVDIGAPDANDEMHIIVVDKDGVFTGVPGALLEKFSYVSKATDAKTLDNEPNFYGSIINKQSEYIWYMGVPTTGYAADGSIQSITPVGDGLYGTSDVPTVTITGDGTSGAATAVMGTSGVAIDASINSGGVDYEVADVVTLSNDVTVTVNTVDGSGTITAATILVAGTDVVDATADAATGGSGTSATFDVEAGFDVASVTVTTAGINYTTATVSFEAADSANGTDESNATPVVLSTDLSEWNENLVAGIEYKTLLWSSDPSGGGVNDGEALVYQLAGGDDGGAVTSDELIVGWTMYENAEVVDVSLLFVGDAGGSSSSQAVIQHVIDNVVEARKDCIVCFSPEKADVFNVTAETATENCIAYRNTTINRPSSYAIMDSGWKYQYDLVNDKYRWIPLNADIAGLCANTDEVADPWYSPAGYTRGRIKNVISLALNPSKTNRDELYKVGINPVVSFAGEGVILYGDRTQQTKSDAFSKINIRRLFIVLEKAIARASKYSLFEFNDQFTRAQFKNMVEPFLREVKGRRGVSDFAVVCDETNNTPEVIVRSEFVASILIKPAYSINFITLNFVAVRPGVEFEEVVGRL